MVTAIIEHTGLADRIATTISADEIRTYKPATRLYRHAGERTGTAPEHVAHISADWFDACGAENEGMQGVSQNRTGRPKRGARRRIPRPTRSKPWRIRSASE